MAEHHSEPWYPTAAYLYTLHLDGPALAWEYLRRNPDYRLDWLRRRRRSETAHRWGLRVLEDPALDAREAQPAWFPDHDGVLQLYPDADPSMDAIVFSFWSLPGSKSLIHDGKRLMLVLRWPGYSLRLAIAPGLADGMAFAYAIRACAQLPGLTAMLQKLATAADASPAATASVRPSLSALQELHTLQTLDATLAGVSLHEIAKGLFGEDAAADWYSDGGLRSKVRRLVQRGETLMRGGYRRLAQLPPLEKGRSESRANRP